MDRRFLSDEQIIKISRDFVCIRLATYEDKTEAVFLKETFLGQRGGDLRNFGYCILSPDGKKKLRRSDRGPNYVYADAKAMAADLRQVASQYSGKTKENKSDRTVPRMKSVRLAVNVASCDGLPSVIVVGKNQIEVDLLNKKLNSVIWDEALIGRFIYASTTNLDDLKIVSGAASKTGILVVEPDPFGMKGKLITAIKATASNDDLKQSLAKAADDFTRNAKTHGTHVRDGRRSGTTWKTEVEVPTRRRGRTRPGQ